MAHLRSILEYELDLYFTDLSTYDTELLVLLSQASLVDMHQSIQYMQHSTCKDTSQEQPEITTLDSSKSDSSSSSEYSGTEGSSSNEYSSDEDTGEYYPKDEESNSEAVEDIEIDQPEFDDNTNELSKELCLTTHFKSPLDTRSTVENPENKQILGPIFVVYISHDCTANFYNFQLEGVKWMLKQCYGKEHSSKFSGGFICDQMGLGKSGIFSADVQNLMFVTLS